MSLQTVLLAASTAVTIFSQIKQGKQEAQVFEFNAAISRQKVELAVASGRITQERLRKRATSFQKRQVAAFAKAGVRLTGSPLQVLSDTAAELEFDILIEDFNTRVAVLNALTGTELELLRASQATTSSLFNAGSTLLTVLPSFIRSGNIPTIDPSASTPKEQELQMSLLPSLRN